MNIIAMFMQMMNSLFADMLDKGAIVFLDDVLIYSTMAEEHFELLEKVFARLCKYKFYCKLNKCSFLWRTNTFLGFDITPKKLKISNSKVQSLKKWPKSATV